MCHLNVWRGFTPPQDMIHIADTKVARRYGDFFIRQIHKFEEVSHDTLDFSLHFLGCKFSKYQEKFLNS